MNNLDHAVELETLANDIEDRSISMARLLMPMNIVALRAGANALRRLADSDKAQAAP